jgi:hypothetical protein
MPDRLHYHCNWLVPVLSVSQCVLRRSNYVGSAGNSCSGPQAVLLSRPDSHVAKTGFRIVLLEKGRASTRVVLESAQATVSGLHVKDSVICKSDTGVNVKAVAKLHAAMLQCTGPATVTLS